MTQTLGIQELAQALDRCDQHQPSRVLDLIALLQREPDREIAEKVGKTRAWVQQKRSGRQPIRLADLAVLANALEVPPELFVETPEAANLWLIANKAELFRCLAA